MSTVPTLMDKPTRVGENFWFVRLGSIAAAVALALLVEVLASKGSGLFDSRMVTLAALYVTLAVSLNLVNGITGQFSIGHAGFFQVGAYTAALVSAQNPNHGMPAVAWIALMSVAGGICAAVFGIVVGLPSLRLRGDYLAIVTLGFGEIVRIFVNTQPWMGGSYGINLQPKFPAVFLAVILAVACIALCRNLLRSAHGLPFLAVREDEIAANAMGVNTTIIKVTAFVLASAFAGAAGAIFAHTEAFISPKSFNMDLSFMILTMVVLGGSGSITGSAVAAIALFYLPEALRDAPSVRAPVLAGALLLVALLTAAAKKAENEGESDKQKLMTRLIIGIGLSVVIGIALSFVPSFSGQQFEAQRLRMVIFAVALIVAMLLRPQGIFAHHEFSWDWLRRRAKGEAA